MTNNERYTMRIADEFIEDLAKIYSVRLLNHIRMILEMLEVGPEIGSSFVRTSLTKRFGLGIRKIPVSTFVIVYRFDGTTIDVLALVYGPSIT